MAEDNKKQDKYSIIVNGEEKHVEKNHVSYEEVVELAFPIPPSSDTRFTVSYRNAKSPNSSGSLIAGQSVHIQKEGTIFNVRATTKS